MAKPNPPRTIQDPTFGKMTLKAVGPRFGAKVSNARRKLEGERRAIVTKEVGGFGSDKVALYGGKKIKPIGSNRPPERRRADPEPRTEFEARMRSGDLDFGF